MRITYLAYALGLILMYAGLVILAPVIVAIIDKDAASILPFVTASIIAVSAGYGFRKFAKRANEIENLNDIKKQKHFLLCQYRGFCSRLYQQSHIYSMD